MKSCISIAVILILSEFLANPAEAQKSTDKNLHFVSLGDFSLESGKIIYDCKIAYRAYGKLNAAKSNAIIFPSWFTGNSKDLESLVPGKMIDTTNYYLLLVDAIGDGYSSSPDNAPKQPGLSFPVFTISDMVESQYRMLTEKLNIHHLVAVAGISMGGMQSFQWAVSHPDFMDKVIPIVGSPQLSSNDLLLWNSELQAMERDTAYHHGRYRTRPALKTVSMIHHLALTTPSYMTDSISRDKFDAWSADVQNAKNFDWNNWHRQLEAMLSHDIAKKTNSSLEASAKLVKAKFLIIASKQDQMVNPASAVRFGKMIHAKMLELDSQCGHLAVGCEMVKIITAIQEFLRE